MPETDLHRGARIGTRIAMLVSNALVHTHSKLLDVKHKLAVMVFNTISNEISDEVDMTLGPLLKRMAQAYEDGGHVAGMMEFMAHGRGQFKAIVGSSATAQSLLWALGTVISNELAPVSYDLIATSPHLIPDSATIASFAATGHISEADAAYQIARNGFNKAWANAWIDTARQWPSPADITDWVNKKLLSRSDGIALLQKTGYTYDLAAGYINAAFEDVSYQDAALAYLRGAIDIGVVYELAEKQGVDSESVDIYLQTIGEPPGTMDLLEGFRRGFIDQSALRRGIKQSRTRDEWIPLIEELRYSPMSVADAVNATVQGHMEYGVAEKIADQNGLEPGQFDTLYQTAGEPLSRTELNELFLRGLIGSDVVLQGLRESRIKNKYVEDAFALRRRLLEPRTLSAMVHNGSMTHDVAIRKAMENGYNKEDAEYLIASASNQKMQSYRDRVMQDVETLFTDGAYTPEQLTNAAHSLGYSDEEAKLMLQAAEYKRDQRAFTAATGVIRSKLTSHHIDKGTASNMLDGIGMPASQRDYLLGFWEMEAAANTRELTQAQIIKALKDGVFTATQTIKRLMELGYSETDAGFLVEMA